MDITAEHLTDVMADHFPAESVSHMYGEQWICAAENDGRGCTFSCDRGDIRAWFDHLASQAAPVLQH